MNADEAGDSSIRDRLRLPLVALGIRLGLEDFQFHLRLHVEVENPPGVPFAIDSHVPGSTESAQARDRRTSEGARFRVTKRGETRWT